MNTAAGQAPQQISIHRAEGELPTRGALTGIGNVVEQPGKLRSGKIRIEQQPCFGRQCGLMAGRFEPRAQIGSAPVLPDDGAVDRPPAGAVPQ